MWRRMDMWEDVAPTINIHYYKNNPISNFHQLNIFGNSVDTTYMDLILLRQLELLSKY